MNILRSSDEFTAVLSNKPLVMAYLSGTNCSVCHSIKPKIEQAMSQQFPMIQMVEIPTEQFPELCAQLMVFSVPTVILWVDRREYLREVRMISIDGLVSKIDKIVSLLEE
jgi:thioredoxin-like negative regulator of GroEL